MSPASSHAAVPAARRRPSRYHFALLAIVVAVWVWAAIAPRHRPDWLLENLLVFVGVPLVVGLGFYFRLSNLSYTLITIFMVMHLVGSHYTYAEVPFGFTLQRWFGAERNMYDRLVHFAFGFLLAYPLCEIFYRVGRARGFWAYYLPVELAIASSTIYELMEWGIAEIVAPDSGLAFLGAQGDPWDAQKDIALAGVGAVLAMLLTFFIVSRIDPDTLGRVRESLRIPHGDHPLGEEQIAAWWRRRHSRSS